MLSCGQRPHTRRAWLGAAAAGAASLALGARSRAAAAAEEDAPRRRPNLLFILADQWRAQAFGHAGDPNAKTPAIDRLASESVRFAQAVSTCPVCSPCRASLMTGRYPLAHGVFINDVPLRPDAVSIAQAFGRAGYDTAYVGKWHLDGSGSRSAFIPHERRQGFEYWKVLECTHDYNNSAYWGDEPVKRTWEGYDAIAQTRDAQRYIREHARGRPFAFFLSWGPPHDPYLTAPAEYRALFAEPAIALRPNVPPAAADAARRNLAGYYAHCVALDRCAGELLGTLKECGIEDDTIVVFTSDHGDMLGSHGETHKQRPWDESILVPFLLRYPAALGRQARRVDMLLSTPDIMPTVLGLCGVDVPATVEGANLAPVVLGTKPPPADSAALIMCASPFGQWTRKQGGKEYRGIRTKRFTYVRDLAGPWLLYDNDRDPYQLTNLVKEPGYDGERSELDWLLVEILTQTRDEFKPGAAYLKTWGYAVNADGTMPYKP